MLGDSNFIFKTYIVIAAAPIAPKTRINKIIPINEIINPAIDNPFGDLNTPTKDKTSPKSQIIHPKNGIHPRNNAIKARTNPAVPIPFDFFHLD